MFTNSRCVREVRYLKALTKLTQPLRGSHGWRRAFQNCSDAACEDQTDKAVATRVGALNKLGQSPSSSSSRLVVAVRAVATLAAPSSRTDVSDKQAEVKEDSLTNAANALLLRVLGMKHKE